ncbi:MAG: helix-turn-helix domain-containing protein [Treponema sp.]|nr:helix-turn-helix domain-containing protein [Treponema sp.]
MTNLRELLGSNMKIYRKSAGLSQSKLAERVDTATNYISAIEAGRRFPSIEMLERIAIALNIDTTDLLSKKNVQDYSEMKKTEEQIWLNISQNLSTYITENIQSLQNTKVRP